MDLKDIQGLDERGLLRTNHLKSHEKREFLKSNVKGQDNQGLLH